MQDLISKAATLLEALPYIQKFSGETFVVKYGGSFMDSPDAAVRHGVARALLRFDANLRPTLKSEGFLTRDPRMKERKKYGQPGARKRFQYSKR